MTRKRLRPRNDFDRLRPAQNLVNKVGGAAEQVREAWSIGHQTSRFDPFPEAGYRRQSRSESQAVDRLLCRNDCCGSLRNNDMDLQPDELGGGLGEASILAEGNAGPNRAVLIHRRMVCTWHEA
jgi:hypothetical protein